MIGCTDHVRHNLWHNVCLIIVVFNVQYYLGTGLILKFAINCTSPQVN